MLQMSRFMKDLDGRSPVIASTTVILMAVTGCIIILSDILEYR